VRGVVAHPDLYEMPSFGWHAGEIASARPDDDTFRKAVEIATELGARVVDDDGKV
jgi:hypothetical protein